MPKALVSGPGCARTSGAADPDAEVATRRGPDRPASARGRGRRQGLRTSGKMVIDVSQAAFRRTDAGLPERPDQGRDLWAALPARQRQPPSCPQDRQGLPVLLRFSQFPLELSDRPWIGRAPGGRYDLAVHDVGGEWSEEKGRNPAVTGHEAQCRCTDNPEGRQYQDGDPDQHDRKVTDRRAARFRRPRHARPLRCPTTRVPPAAPWLSRRRVPDRPTTGQCGDPTAFPEGGTPRSRP
jgi:hypothetical protein